MKIVNKSNLRNPTESGWYICKYTSGSVLHYDDEENCIGRYDICNCRPALLYWESNVWLTNPRSFNVIEERNILDWEKVPDRFNIMDEKIRLNFYD